MKSLLSIICLLLNVFFASTSFQTTLFKEINKEFINKNVVISPLSAFQILGLTANGAKGTTLKQMVSALENASLVDINTVNGEIVKLSKSFSTVEIANAIFTTHTPKPEFSKTADLYDATVETLKSVTQVNNWCNLKTHGKIKEIMNGYDPNTVMILLNAIYFKGTWKTEFNEKKTQKRNFYNLNDKSNVKSVDLMSIVSPYLYYGDNQVQIIDLPYKDDYMSATIILPNENININDYLSNLSDDNLQKYIKKMSAQNVSLALPKFELDFSSSLTSALKKMGMKIPFASNADFSGLTDVKGAYISDVFQKAFLNVDEKGTEAAAVTSVTVTTKSMPKPIPSMIVNRPFLFLLRNKKFPKLYEMLFMSKIEQL